MSRFGFWAVIICLSSHVFGAERNFDFSAAKSSDLPPGFRSTISGDGKPGEWKITEDEVAPAFSANSAVIVRRPVLAQLSRDITDERFPLLIFEQETFGDFTFTTRFKAVSGAVEQMAGVAFRIQNEKNYYVVRASSLGNTFRFYKFVNGVRSNPIGPEVEIPKGVWHELTIDCKGNQIRCTLNGKHVIPLTDNSFTEGKIGFWTKSDSVSYFTDARIVYTPKETLAKTLVRDMLQKYPRLLGLKVFATPSGANAVQVVASDDEKEIGTAATDVERDVIERDVVYFGRTKKTVMVTLPLHDRNGDAVAAVRVTMDPFPGQTEQNAIVRATPIVKEMQNRVRSVRDLTQ